MAYIDDAILEDIGRVLVDCAGEFRRHEAAEKAKTEGITSLVDLDDANRNATRYGAFAAVCEKYARLTHIPEDDDAHRSKSEAQ